MTDRRWLKVDGVNGVRSVEEQTEALRTAMDECEGKTILDLGSAEGLIAREFIKAGAKHATCIEALINHVAVGTEYCRGYPVEFINANIADIASQHVARYDIVLCLGIAHKLKDPGICIRFAADCCNDLLLLRSGRAADENGVITSKFVSDGEPGQPAIRKTCDAPVILKSRGFNLERIVQGPAPHSELVYYWRRVKQ